MDTDLDQMTREELIAEVKKLRQGIVCTATAAARSSVGISRPVGVPPEQTDPAPSAAMAGNSRRGCARISPVAR